MAAKYAVFLRAINVGGHVVKMDALRTMFEEMGFANVATLIASGNLIVESKRAASEATIEKALHKALGYEVATFVRTPAELARVAEIEPFAKDDAGTLYIGFCKSPISAEAIAKLQAAATSDDAFHFDGRELYWLRRKGVNESKLAGAAMERLLGQKTTMRNRNTVVKMVGKLG